MPRASSSSSSSSSSRKLADRKKPKENSKAISRSRSRGRKRSKSRSPRRSRSRGRVRSRSRSRGRSRGRVRSRSRGRSRGRGPCERRPPARRSRSHHRRSPPRRGPAPVRRSPPAQNQSRRSPPKQNQSRRSPPTQNQSRRSPPTQNQSRRSPPAQNQSKLPERSSGANGDAPVGVARESISTAGPNSVTSTDVRPSILPAPSVSIGDLSDSSCASAPGSPKSRAAHTEPKLGVLYWGGGLDGVGWDLLGRNPGGFPRIHPGTDALVDSWRGRMENAQVTLRMCASEGPGFKRYVKHFMMLSAQACMEFRLPQYHRFNTEKKRKVLTERIVIGGIIEANNGQAPPTCGIRVNNGGPGQAEYLAYVRRRARRYRLQAHRHGGHFAALILDGNGCELNIASMLAATKNAAAQQPARIKRLLVILGGPHGIRPDVSIEVRHILEKYTDFPMVSVALPGGILHSYYALATLFVFHDHGLLIPYLETCVGQPRPPEPEKPQAERIEISATPPEQKETSPIVSKWDVKDAGGAPAKSEVVDISVEAQLVQLAQLMPGALPAGLTTATAATPGLPVSTPAVQAATKAVETPTAAEPMASESPSAPAQVSTDVPAGLDGPCLPKKMPARVAQPPKMPPPPHLIKNRGIPSLEMASESLLPPLGGPPPAAVKDPQVASVEAPLTPNSPALFKVPPPPTMPPPAALLASQAARASSSVSQPAGVHLSLPDAVITAPTSQPSGLPMPIVQSFSSLPPELQGLTLPFPGGAFGTQGSEPPGMPLTIPGGMFSAPASGLPSPAPPAMPPPVSALQRSAAFGATAKASVQPLMGSMMQNLQQFSQ